MNHSTANHGSTCAVVAGVSLVRGWPNDERSKCYFRFEPLYGKSHVVKTLCLTVTRKKFSFYCNMSNDFNQHGQNLDQQVGCDKLIFVSQRYVDLILVSRQLGY